MNSPPVNLMIVGLKEVDAGKTTVSSAALSAMRERGLTACGFKPKAGNNLWYDYDIVHESLSQGRLFGKDSKMLREFSSTDLPEEAVSPFHRLLAIPPEHRDRRIPDPLYFIVDRATIWGEEPEQVIVLNNMFDIDAETDDLLYQLRRASSREIEVRSSKELNEVQGALYERAIESAHRLVRSESEAIVYESYADAALPWSGIADLDLVLGVEPGFILEYDPEKYLQAASMYSSLLQDGTTGKVAKLLKPNRVVPFPPSVSGERIETAKDLLQDTWDL